jgi:Resolvase, N terminal domain
LGEEWTRTQHHRGRPKYEDFTGECGVQFNTSTPVGRLTLHILLSFAQFEREIISERGRVAALRTAHRTQELLQLICYNCFLVLIDGMLSGRSVVRRPLPPVAGFGFRLPPLAPGCLYAVRQNERK